MDLLEAYVKTITITKQSGYGGFKTRMNARGGRPRSDVLGSIKHIATKSFRESIALQNNRKLKELCDEVAKSSFPDFVYSHIQVNHNFECLPHKDSKNVGDSVIFTLGDFTGGHCNIDGQSLDIYKNPTTFNGSKLEHYVEKFDGDRYAFIYFNNPSMGSVIDYKKILDLEVPSDHKVYEEIFVRKIYDKSEFIKRGERWLDLGANIGAFSLYCLSKGAIPTAYEPSSRNYEKLNKLSIVSHRLAVGPVATKSPLYLEKNNQWRHTLIPVQGRDTEMVDVIGINDLDLGSYDGIKMDIEGSELEVIYAMETFPKKLIFEYDGGHHKRKETYDSLISHLKTKYISVTAPVLKADINFFPNGLLVRCADFIDTSQSS